MGRRDTIWPLVSTVLAWLAAASFATPAVHAHQKPSQKQISQELQALHDDDQRDQDSPEAETITEAFSQRQKVRRDRVVEILAAGMLATPVDYANAALLMQHGHETDDYLVSHVLATAAVFEGGAEFAEFLSAASLDRFLMHLKLPQRFGTQGVDPTATKLEDFVPSIGNAVRAVYKLDALPEATWTEHGASDKKPPSAKEVGRRFKELRREEKALAAKDARALERHAERCAWVMELVRTGDLAKKEELFQAASILYESQDAEQLLHAHVLAVAAAFAGHAEGKRLSAETLDRWLIAAVRPQRFGTQVQDSDAKPHEPWDQALHDVIRKAYGLSPLNADKGKKK